jgi:hypothetical protein
VFVERSAKPGTFEAANGSADAVTWTDSPWSTRRSPQPNNSLTDTIARARGGGCAALRSGSSAQPATHAPRGTSQAGRPVGGQWVLYTRGNSSAGPPENLSVPCSGCVTDAIDSDQICGMKTAISMNWTVRPGESLVRPVGGQNPPKEADYPPRSNQLQRFGRIAQCRVLASPAR